MSVWPSVTTKFSSEQSAATPASSCSCAISSYVLCTARMSTSAGNASAMLGSCDRKRAKETAESEWKECTESYASSLR